MVASGVHSEYKHQLPFHNSDDHAHRQCKEHNKNVYSHCVLGYVNMGDLVFVRRAVTILVAGDSLCGVVYESDYCLNIRNNFHYGYACVLCCLDLQQIKDNSLGYI
jgi:hypothetical protein